MNIYEIKKETLYSHNVHLIFKAMTMLQNYIYYIYR